MTDFGLTSPNPAEFDARAALNDGLESLRTSMRGILADPAPGLFRRVIRGENGVPRTRQRPHHNEAPPRQNTGDNILQRPDRPGASDRPGLISRPGPPRPTLAPTSDTPTRDTIPTQGGSGAPQQSPNSGPQGPANGPQGPGGAPQGPNDSPGPNGAQDPNGAQQTPVQPAPPVQPARPAPGDAALEVWGLIELAQGGDAAAFGKLYDRYFDTVFRFVYFRVGNRQLAEDLTADTFLRALKRISSFTWQGRNLVADHFKSGRYRLEVTTGDVLDADRPDRGPEGSPEAAVIDHITNVDLLKGVKQLNPEQQECIVLRFLHGFSVAETAQAMGKNEGAIKALQYRAVRALARLLPEGFQP
jgi:RNA polymerase sigma-70 factor, ECF subfamily